MNKTPNLFFLPILMVFMSVVAFEAIATVAIQGDQTPPISTEDRDNAIVLSELSMTLKAAVLSGTLSEEDAIEIYNRMSRTLTTDNAKKTARTDDGSDGPYASKLDIMRLAAYRPGQITALFQPEFLRRDVQLLRRELDLDREQLAIIEMLLRDYLEAFELASSPVREALGRYRRSSADQWVSEALQRANIDEVEVAVANTRDALQQLDSEADQKNAVGETSPDRAEETDQKRAAREAWARRMVEVTATMEDRLAALRERVQSRITHLERAGSMVTIEDLVRMARELRSERSQLRAEFTESLGLIVLIEQTDAAQARFNTALARVRIEHGLSRGRLGGESMNLWAALNETTRANGSRRGRRVELHEVKALLDERATVIAKALDVRTEAAISRELRGLGYLATRERISAAADDPARRDSALRPFVEASRHELTASVAVRDELLTLLDESSASIDVFYPDTNVSRAFREAVLRRGFRTEMRQRFSERALRGALRLDDLNDESRDALVAIESEVATTLRTLRADAIAKRIRRDPRRALERIEARFEGRSSRWGKLDLEELLGFNHKAYTALDERIEYQLRTILTSEQFAELPPRQKVITGDKGKTGVKNKK